MSKLDNVIERNQSMYASMDDEFKNLENIILNAFKVLDEYDKLVKSPEIEV